LAKSFKNNISFFETLFQEFFFVIRQYWDDEILL